MRSPRHLAVLVFVVAVLVIAAGIIIPQLTGANARTPGAVAETTSKSTTAPGAPTTSGAPPTTTSSLPTRITTVTETPTSAPPSQDALDVAGEWGKAWVDHPQGITNEEWLKDLRPLTTEEQLTEMATVEPGNIGPTQVTGDPEAIESYTSSVTVKLPTDDGDLLITVIDTPDGWRVQYYEQVDR